MSDPLCTEPSSSYSILPLCPVPSPLAPLSNGQSVSFDPFTFPKPCPAFALALPFVRSFLPSWYSNLCSNVASPGKSSLMCHPCHSSHYLSCVSSQILSSLNLIVRLMDLLVNHPTLCRVQVQRKGALSVPPPPQCLAQNRCSLNIS